MGCRVVCISRNEGAGGEEVGHSVASQLGFRYIDDEIVVWAAEKAGVTAEELAQAEHRGPLLDRILKSMAGEGFAMGVAPADNVAYWDRPSDYQDMIRSTISETAAAGDVVIVAHAASMALAGQPGILRVLLTASPEVRTERIASQRGLDEHAAEREIRDSDRERRDYFRRFYGIRDEMPTHYDLVVNTDVLTAEHAAEIVVAAARV